MPYSTHYNVKRFFRHLAEASKHLKERDESRKELAAQLERVSIVTKDKRTRSERIEKELVLLIQKINDVVEKEKRFAMVHKMDTGMAAELRKEQMKNRELLKNIAESLSMIKLRLKHAKGLKKPIEELEKIIPTETKEKVEKKVIKKKKTVKKKAPKQSIVSKEKIKLMKKELQLLKKKYSIMQKAKRSKKELDEVKKQIEGIEKKL